MNYKKTQMEHVAESFVAFDFDLEKTAVRLRTEAPFRSLQAQMVRGWFEKNTDGFALMVKHALKRALESSFGLSCFDPIAAAERMISEIEGRLEFWRQCYQECITAKNAKKTNGGSGKNENIPTAPDENANGAGGPDGERKVKQAAQINRELIKLEEHLRKAYEFLNRLQNPKGGEAAQDAVETFVDVLFRKADTQQREMLIAIVPATLPGRFLTVNGQVRTLK